MKKHILKYLTILVVLIFALAACQTAETTTEAPPPPPTETEEPADEAPEVEPTDVPETEEEVVETEEVDASEDMADEEDMTPSYPASEQAEVGILEILLAGNAAEQDAEISGIAWYDEFLILFPQYPNFTTDYTGDGVIYAIHENDLVNFITGASADPITPIEIPFSDGGLHESIEGFEGYESVTFEDDIAYVTIEAEPGDMVGYVVTGTMASDLSGLVLSPDNVTMIEPQAGIGNMSDESIFIAGDNIFTLYEANGVGVNPNPVAHSFNKSLEEIGTVPLENVEYRITDITELDSDGRFWGINYFFPGDEALLPETDPIAATFGQGETHAMYPHVERLVEFQYTESGISITDTDPIQISLDPEDARNWEGLVRMHDRGFIVATDKWPQTILGFVPLPGVDLGMAFAPETALTLFDLTGPITERDAEISGMAWWEDYLILLPQYPNWQTDYEGDGIVFALKRDDIIAYLDGELESLTPMEIPFSDGGLHNTIEGFEGYEGIAFYSSIAYFTIESEPDGIFGYVAQGEMTDFGAALTVDPSSLVEIEPQTDIENMSEESIVFTGSEIFTLYEANGAGVNPEPIAHIFDMFLENPRTIPMTNVEYRVTDATALSADNTFWVINYFFPGESVLFAADEPLAAMYGQGGLHYFYPHVERLVELQYTEEGITLTDTPPIQIQLIHSGSARNLEAIAVLEGRGLIVATDKWPFTIVAFVPFPE